MSVVEIIILVSVLASAIGAGVFFLIRYLKKNEEKIYDYATCYGTRIILSPQTKNVSVSVFEAWTESVVCFWAEKNGWDKEQCYQKLSQTEIEIFDAEYLERNGYKVSGLVWPSTFLIEVSTFPKGKSQASMVRLASLFRHEVSHIIVGYVGNLEAGPNGGEFHHKLFADVGLEA